MSKEKGEHGTCSTVKIKVTSCEGNEEGIVIINEADYDPEVHELVGDDESDAGKGENDKGKGKKGKKAKDESDAGKGEK